MAVTYSVFSSSMSLDSRLQISADIAEKHDEVFWAVSETTQGISLQISKNFTEIKMNIERLEKAYCKHNVTSEPSITLLPFPFKLSKVINFFDFAPFLNQIFDLKKGDNEQVPAYGGDNNGVFLNESEKPVYHALIKYPSLSDKELAEILSISRHTIARARKKFENDALIKTIRIVDLKKLGFEILVLNHFSFNMKLSEGEKKRGIEALMENKQPIFMVLGDVEGVSLVPYKSFEEYRECCGKIADLNKKIGMFSKAPTSLLLSTTSMTHIKDHDYAPLTKKILGIYVD